MQTTVTDVCLLVDILSLSVLNSGSLVMDKYINQDTHTHTHTHTNADHKILLHSWITCVKKSNMHQENRLRDIIVIVNNRTLLIYLFK